MQLFLMGMNLKNAPTLFGVYPQVAETQNFVPILQQIFQSNIRPQRFDEIITIAERNFANYLFCTSSQVRPDGTHFMMISVLLDEHENSNVFSKTFQKYIEKLRGMPSALDQLMGGTNPAITSLLIECHKELENMNKKGTGLAELIILGIGAVGKSCIINRLVNNKFDSQFRPTLSTQILKLMFEQMDFRVYDVGGQEKLRQFWTTAVRRPQAIIYTIDSTHQDAQHQDSAREFNRMMTHYFVTLKLPNTIPVLIVANKIDKNPAFTEQDVIAKYHPELFNMNYKIGLISAMTGQGLTENFQWLVKQVKVTAR